MAAFLPGDASYVKEKCLSDAVPAKLFPHEKILQENTGASPARIKIIEERVANRLSIPLRNQGAEFWLRAKAILRQGLFRSEHRVWFALILCQFAREAHH